MNITGNAWNKPVLKKQAGDANGNQPPAIQVSD